MRVLFVSSGINGNKPSPIILTQGESLKKYGIKLDYFTINEKRLKGYIKEGVRLYRYLRLNNYDIIHAHYGLSAIVALLAKNSNKLVVSFMGDDLLGANRIDGSITKLSRLLAFINSLMAKYIYDYSVVKSKEMLNKLNTNNVSIIPNGVNVDMFKSKDKAKSRDHLNLNNRDKIILFVSNPSRVEKNYSLASNAVKKVNIPECYLLVVSNRLQEELVYYYNASDLVILTSFHEGSPNVIKEAMACNRPIVSTNIGDVEWVLGGTEGCYISNYNTEEYSKKIKLALKFSEEKGRTNGRNRILELGLDAETTALKIIDVYKKVIN